MNALFVVDLQDEFVKDGKGKKVYAADLEYINNMRSRYDAVYAAVYINKQNINMVRMVGWNEMQKKVRPMRFTPDDFWTHDGYAIQTYPFQRTDKVDIIGFDTDACVLNACFDLFNRNVNFRILVNGCWSSGGADMHKAGLAIMRRQFRNAVDEITKI